MKRRFPTHFYRLAGIALTLQLCAAAQAAVVPDRTRVIYNADAQSESLTISNKSATYPYVVQSWIEDSTGRRITSPFMVLPPLQRIEPNERNIVRIVKLPGDALPTDRESVFYLNVREIPPKTDVQNAIQIALHSKIKLFYRPKGVQPQQDEDVSLPMTLRLDATHHKLVFDNPTPYHVTVVELAAGEEKKVLKFDAVMVEPKATAEVDFTGALPATLYVSHMNDWGGQNAVKYTCDASTCRSVQP
ncbi:molecular chaperone [Ralstonia insidiosa]|jgi:fimbrial chaperone protein|uniref:Fimbrial protein n=1 Tax=Ralstonia insidiosa TaxID=190721 RepID=A0A192A5F7_9RALS|nr:molecular chaperone [Ralstonia insidiosa]ANJ75578.1 fimbrial protein [Ralstonia insidiosa]KAB0469629.1 molecular chaperone [Ralstonia insidiosa]MBY4910331.1 molecular chaperone [Ralstonia insidiosa]